MIIKTLITPEEISTLARPCYADEEKALAYIVEAEQNNIKPAIGDDLFIQLKEGGQTFLLEGGIYERDGKRYELNGIKRALAYFVISRLYESSTTELTRQGVVNRRSEYSDNADERDIISVSRETYAIANRYMEEIERYLGTDVKNTSQRVHFDLIGGGSKTQRTCRSTPSSGGSSPSSPSANINVVQVLGDSTKDVVSQAGVTREFNALRDEIKGIEAPTLPTLAKVAETGDYNDLKNKPTIPDVRGFAAKEDLNKKQNKTAIVTAIDVVSVDNRSVIDVTRDVRIRLKPYEEDGYAHSYEIILNVGDTAYLVAFPEDVVWVKDLEIELNKRYMIIIDDSMTAMWVAVERSEQ